MCRAWKTEQNYMFLVVWMSQHKGVSGVSTGGDPIDTLTVQLAEHLQDHHYVCVCVCVCVCVLCVCVCGCECE